MSRWYTPPPKAELSPEAQRRLQELRAATEDCERRYDITSIDRLVRAAKLVNDAFGVAPVEAPSKCEFPVCAVHHPCERNCERRAAHGVNASQAPSMAEVIAAALDALEDNDNHAATVILKTAQRNAGVDAVAPARPFTWPPKACPCGSVQRDGCEEHGCKWERDPSLVPEALRSYGVPGTFNDQEEKTR